MKTNIDKRERQAVQNTTYNNGMAVQGGRPPLSQIAKVFVGRAIVSVHLRPVSTPSLRSVGHSSQVHGTQAQYKLATSQCLNVVSNACRKDNKYRARKAKQMQTPRNGIK